MSRPRWLQVLLAVLLLSSGPGAVGQDEAEGDPEPWYFSVYNGDSRHWIPEQPVEVSRLPRPMVTLEVTQFPDVEEPTAAQKRAADELIERSRAAAERNGWFDYEKAREAGFARMFDDPIHYGNREFLFDDKILDPEHPEFLLFYQTDAGPRLAAFMYLVRKPEERGPQIGGPEVIWHYHVWKKPKCLLNDLVVVGRPDESGVCAEGELSHRSPEMVHVWFVDHPMGPFATKMSLPPEIIEELAKRPY